MTVERYVSGKMGYAETLEFLASLIREGRQAELPESHSIAIAEVIHTGEITESGEIGVPADILEGLHIVDFSRWLESIGVEPYQIRYPSHNGGDLFDYYSTNLKTWVSIDRDEYENYVPTDKEVACP